MEEGNYQGQHPDDVIFHGVEWAAVLPTPPSVLAVSPASALTLAQGLLEASLR